MLPPLLPPILPPLVPEDPERGAVRHATTGSGAERVRSVEVARRPGGAERVVVSLGPERLPRVRTGDRLEVRAEVQVSTTCLFRGPRCVGRRYRFSPLVSARLILARSAEARRGLALSPTERVRCTQRRPNRNHHCVLAFPAAGADIIDVAGLPCAPEACWINLVLGASHPAARRGTRVVLGGDRPDGDIVQDRARMSAVFARREAGPPAELSTAELRRGRLRPGSAARHRVLYSVELPALRDGEVIAADGGFEASIAHLGYNAFLASRLILATTPDSVEPTGLAASASSSRGQLTESNGFNCTRGRSGYSSPCAVVKAGTVRITERAVDDLGIPRPLYVNLVARAKPLLGRRRAHHRVHVSPAEGGLRVLRYTPR